MAEKKNQNQVPQDVPQEKQSFACSGDCLNCSAGQRQYCASQNAYYTMRILQQAMARMTELKTAISELDAKIEEIQRSTGTAQRIEPQDS